MLVYRVVCEVYVKAFEVLFRRGLVRFLIKIFQMALTVQNLARPSVHM